MRNESDDRTNWFDDGVLDDDRVRRVIRGRRRNLHLREYNRGEGDWETFCRTVALLKVFISLRGHRWRLLMALSMRRMFA